MADSKFKSHQCYMVSKNSNGTGTVTITPAVYERKGIMFFGGANGDDLFGSLDVETVQNGGVGKCGAMKNGAYVRYTTSYSNGVITISGLPSWSQFTFISDSPFE